jgi:integrase
VLSLGKDPETQKRKQLKFYGKTSAEVRARLDEAKDRRRHGTLPSVASARMTAGEWFDRWLEHKKAKVQDGTYNFYEQAVRLRLKPSLGAARLADVSALAVEDLLARMGREGVSADAQGKALGVLRSALKETVRKKLLASNPAADVAKPLAQKTELRPLTEREAAAILEAAHSTSRHRLAALYDLALDSGARQGELLALHWPDIDWDAGVVTIDKSLYEKDHAFKIKPPKSRAGRRRVKLAPRTLGALKAHRERMRAEGRDVERGPVFVNADGGWVSKPSLYKNSWKKVLKAAGLPRMKFHGLRHTSATLLLRKGAGLKMVSVRLGHERPETTLRIYAHVLPEDQDQAAAIFQEMFK